MSRLMIALKPFLKKQVPMLFFIILLFAAAGFSKVNMLPRLPPLTPESTDQPPEDDDAFVNVDLLDHLSRVELERVMGFMAESLNVKCIFCHVKEDFTAGEKPRFKRGRDMIRMVNFSEKQFLKQRLTCYTCHAGSTDPARLPETVNSLPPLLAGDRKQKIPESFKNVWWLTHLTEPQYYQVMSFFVTSMGAEGCNACHVTGKFHLDEKSRKVRARDMIRLVQELNPAFFDSERVTCYTCHRGTFETIPLPDDWGEYTPGENNGKPAM